jgi:putative DNA primase/helicase
MGEEKLNLNVMEENLTEKEAQEIKGIIRDAYNPAEYISRNLKTGYGEGDKKVEKDKEADLALKMASMCVKENFRFGNGYVMLFTGKAYRLMTDKTLESLIVEGLEMRNIGAVYIVNSIAAIRKHLERKITREYKPRKNIVSFSNCILDMDENMTHPHSEQMETDIAMEYDYDPDAQCPKFMRYLHEVLQDEDTMATLQEFCGALFIDRRKYKIENILYLLGTGQNGKGVFANTLIYLLGSQNISSFSVSKLVRDGDRAYNIAAMNGKLANICTDMSKGDISGGDFKTIVSGEPIMARHAYGRPFSADNLPLIIANVNEMPVTTDHTVGHTRRPLPIPFNVYISDEKKDLELESKLRDEVSGIFNWVYEGRKRFIRNKGKFTEGKEIRTERERIRLESNSVLQYMTDNQYAPKHSDGCTELWISNRDIYEKYQQYCRDFGKKNAFEANSMGRILAQEGYTSRRSAGGRGYVVYMGGEKFREITKDEEEEENNLPF